MEINDFRLWEPIHGLTNDIYFYNLENTSNQLVLEFKDLSFEDRVLKINFSGVMAYRVHQETTRNRTLYNNLDLRGFKTSTNSEYLKWFHDESSGIFENWVLVHYFISNIDNVIDIICGLDVSAEWINSHQ